MLLPGSTTKIWIIFMVLISFMVLCEALENRRYPRGTHRSNSDDSGKDKDSSESDSEEKPPKKEKPSQAARGLKPESESESKSLESHDKLLSTRGLQAEDNEPEEDNPHIHVKYDEKPHDSAESDESDNRRKRSINENIDFNRYEIFGY